MSTHNSSGRLWNEGAALHSKCERCIQEGRYCRYCRINVLNYCKVNKDKYANGRSVHNSGGGDRGSKTNANAKWFRASSGVEKYFWYSLVTNSIKIVTVLCLSVCFDPNYAPFDVYVLGGWFGWMQRSRVERCLISCLGIRFRVPSFCVQRQPHNNCIHRRNALEYPEMYRTSCAALFWWKLSIFHPLENMCKKVITIRLYGL